MTAFRNMQLARRATVRLIFCGIVLLGPSLQHRKIELRRICSEEQETSSHEGCGEFEIVHPSGRTERVDALLVPSLTLDVSSVSVLLVFTNREGSAQRSDAGRGPSYRVRMIFGGVAAGALERLVEGHASVDVLVSVSGRGVARTRIDSWSPWQLDGGLFGSEQEIADSYSGGPGPTVLAMPAPGSLAADEAVDRAEDEVRWRLACDPEFRKEVRRRGGALPDGEAPAAVDCTKPPPEPKLRASEPVRVQGTLIDGVREGIWIYLDRTGDPERVEVYDEGTLMGTVRPAEDPDAEHLKGVLQEQRRAGTPRAAP